MTYTFSFTERANRATAQLELHCERVHGDPDETFDDCQDCRTLFGIAEASVSELAKAINS